MVPSGNFTIHSHLIAFQHRMLIGLHLFKTRFSSLDFKAKNRKAALMLAILFVAFGNLAKAQNGDPTDIFFTDCGFILAAEIASPSCPDAMNGQALVYPFLGEALSYEWIGLNNATNTATDLAAGTYQLIVSDGTCTDTIAIPLQDPPSILAPLLDTAVCGFSGTINLLDGISGGAGGYTVTEIVSLLGDDVACAPCDDSVIEVVQTTFLEVFIQDANGCTTSRYVFISLLDLLTATTVTMPETCNDNGRLEVFADGGSGNYLYALENSNTDLQTSNVFEGLAGEEIYSALVFDLEGCVTSADGFVGLEPNFSPAIINTDNATCFGANDGEIEITGTTDNVIGYRLSTSASISQEPFFDNLAPGSYIVFVIEPNNCINGYPVTITQPQQLLVTTSTENLSCPNTTDGVVEIAADGGNGSYLYALNDGVFNQNNTFDHLAAGLYVARVRDARLCENSKLFTIEAPVAPELGAVTSPSCAGETTGSIVIVEAGKLLIGEFEFSLDSITWQSENLFEGLPPGVYTVYIRYPDGCVFSILAIINPSLAPNIEVNIGHLNCYESADGSIVISVAGGQFPFQYALDSSAFQFNHAFQGLAAGAYTVRIADANDCRFSAQVTLNQPAQLTLNYDSQLLGGSWYIDLSAVGGTAPYTYLWSNGETDEDLFFLSSGTYSVTATDAHDCEATLSAMAGTTTAEEQVLTNGVQIFPIPTPGNVQVVFKNPLPAAIQARLSDGRGTVLWQTQFSGGSRFEVPLGDYPSGVYWLSLGGAVYKVIRM